MKNVYRIGALLLVLAAIAFTARQAKSFGAPGDVNNPFWKWVNQGSATASWASGAITMTSDTTASNNLEMLAESTALPATPYAFTAYLDGVWLNNASGCVFGFRESSSGKLATLMMFTNETVNSGAANGGANLASLKWTSPTANTAIQDNFYFPANSGYLRLKNDGTTISFFFSPSGDGVQFSPIGTVPVATAFTTAPDQLVIGVNSATTATNCAFDFVRRTQ